MRRSKIRNLGVYLLLLLATGCAKEIPNKETPNKDTPVVDTIVTQGVSEELTQEVTQELTQEVTQGITLEEVQEETLDSASITQEIKPSTAIEVTPMIQPSPVVEEEELQAESNTVTIGMVGDILLHDRVNASGKKEDGSYEYEHLFANVKEQIKAYDIAIVNQEVILGGTELGLSGYPAFNGAFEVGDALVDAGFDVVLHATNHALDRGKKGLFRCLDFWKTNYPEILVLGIQDSLEEQQEIKVIENSGIRVAILNYTYGTNGIALPEGMPYVVNLLDKDKVAEDIRKAKECSDFILVLPHWGTEYLLSSSDNQEWWAQYFLDCGADLVIGTHPHVIEPVKWLNNEEGDEMLVFYSIGNFINATSGTGQGVANRMVGAIAEVTLTKQEEGKVWIQDYGVEPLVSHIGKEPEDITTYRLSDYTNELAMENQIRSQDATFTLEYCKELCRTVFGSLYDETDD